MIRQSTGLQQHLRRMAWMSSLWLWLGVTLAAAHEITPTIGDLSVADGELVLSLRLNAEALVSGVELHAVEDTEDSAVAADYDRLRALPAADLDRRLRAFADRWRSGLTVLGPGPLPLSVHAVAVPETGNIDLPRFSQLELRAALPRTTQAVTIGWPAGAGDLVLRQQGVEAPFTGLIAAGTQSPPIPLAGGAAPSGWAVFVGYIPVGFDHILPKGLDHILFVLGLFFLSTRLRPLIWQVSAFTLAHTATLALGALGWVSVPGAIVEPLIAASIVYVGIENVFSDRLHRWRPFVIFGFGLLHGLGFASVLGDFGLPQGQFVPALVGFNIGVELGQLTVIALAWLAVGFWFGAKPWYRARIAVPASLVIAMTGAVWFVERSFG